MSYLGSTSDSGGFNHGCSGLQPLGGQAGFPEDPLCIIRLLLRSSAHMRFKRSRWIDFVPSRRPVSRMSISLPWLLA